MLAYSVSNHFVSNTEAEKAAFDKQIKYPTAEAQKARYLYHRPKARYGGGSMGILDNYGLEE